MSCAVRGHPETSDSASLSRLSPPSVSAPEPVCTIPGEGVASSEGMGRGVAEGDTSPQGSSRASAPHLEAPSWDAGAGDGEAPLLAPPILPASPCLTSNRRFARERSADAEWPRRVLRWPRASGPEGVGVEASWPLFTSLWACASDCGSGGASHHRAPGGSTLWPAIPDPAGWANRAAVGAGRGPKRVFGVCCRGSLGTRLGLRRPLPQGFVLTGNVLLEGGAAGGCGRGVCRFPKRPLGCTLS